MSRRIGLVALAALCAVALGTVAASGASAAGTTASTCVEVATNTGEYKNAHCNPLATNDRETKDWKHVTITKNETTQLNVTAIGSTTLKTKIAGANTTLTATGVHCEGCHFTNHEDANGHMDITGAGGRLRYTGVTTSTAGCKIANEEVTTEPLKLTSFAEGELTRAEIAPETGSVEAVIHFENKAGETCPFPPEVNVEGLAKGTATGATAKFETTATGTSELHVGVNNASLKGELTISGGLTGSEHRPVGLTNVEEAVPPGTTASTCVEVATNTGEYKNAHCNPLATNDRETKDWKHVTITKNETTQLNVTAIGSTTLKTKIAGANTTLTATGVHCEGCHFTNHEDANGHMDITGAGGRLRYTGVTTSTAGCKIANEEVTTEPLKLTSFAEGELTRAEIAPETGSVEAVIHFENKAGETCPFPPEVNVEGLAKGTATGATAKFETTATGTSELHVGVNNASLKGELTISGGLTGSEHRPVGLTITSS